MRSILSFTRTASEDSTAISDPTPPIAMPAQALDKARESLMPSPIIQTFFPLSVSFFTALSLSSGIRSAKTLLIPACFAIEKAAEELSPVRRTGVIPCFLRRVIVLRASFRSVSARPIIPMAFPSMEEK